MKRLILALVASLSLCATASAEIYQSSQSGNYLGSGAADGWTCQIRLEAVPGTAGGPINVMQVQCINAAGSYRGGAASFGPSNFAGYCPRSDTNIPLIGFDGVDWITFGGAGIGSFYATLNGQIVVFSRVGLVSVTPYSNCGVAGYLSKPRD